MAQKFHFPNLNPFAAFFSKSRGKKEELREIERLSDAQGVAQEDTALATVGSSTQFGYVPGQDAATTTVTVTGIQFEQVFENKRQKVAKYREMSYYPEIEESTEHVCDDAIVEDDNGSIINLYFKDKIPRNVEKQLRCYFDYLVDDIFNFNETAWDMFKRFLVDAELFGEIVLNAKGNNIIGVKLLPAWTVTPLYSGGIIKGFTQVPEKNYKNKKQIDFDRDQIIYVNYGRFGENMGDVRGYYESSIKTYNQLKNMEDAVVVYRLVRAVERRLWNVWTGRMPKDKAEMYMKGLIQRFKKRMIYDPNTGAVNSAQNVIAMSEDFWFSKGADGEGTTVEQMAGGANLGELSDVTYFLKKLYKVLKIPKSRWADEPSMYSSGKPQEITREEIHFTRFVERLQRKFKYFILDPYFTLLKMRGVDKKYIRSDLIDVYFTESNLFKQFKEMEILDSRMSILNQMSSFLYSSENEAGLFAPKFVLKKYFKMTDDEFAENEAELAELKKANEPPPEPEAPPEEAPPEEAPPEETPEAETGEEGEGEEEPETNEAPAEEEPTERPPDVPEEEKAEALIPKPYRIPDLVDKDNGFDLFDDWKKVDAEIVKKFSKRAGNVIQDRKL